MESKREPEEQSVRTFGSESANPGHRPAGETGRGIFFGELDRFELSASVTATLEDTRSWAAQQRFRGAFGTGLMLIGLLRRGETHGSSDRHYAPRVFAELLRRQGGNGLDAAIARYLEAARLPDDAPSERPNAVSPNLRRCFEDATELPNHDRVVAARHVIVAMLRQRQAGTAPLSSASLLSDARIERDLLLRDFLTHLAEHAPQTERAGWAALLEPRASDRSPLISGYHADTPSGRAADDCLDLKATVDAMANLIASTHLDDTLSIGVFGDWGSGKSFFMKRLRERIREIAIAANDADATKAERAYWPNIAQVEFNAWHYVDANLWASLMSHLLDELRRWQATDDAPLARSPLAAAIEQLEIAATARQAALGRQTAAEHAKSAAEAKQREAEQKVGDAARRLSEAVGDSVWALVQERLAPQLGPAIAALRELGLATESASTSVQGVLAHARDVAATSGRLGATLQQLLRKDGGLDAFRWFLLAVAAAVVVVALLALLFDPLRDLTVVVATTIAGAAATAGKFVTLLRDAATKVQARLEPVLAARAAIESALAQAEQDKAARVAVAEGALAQARAALDAANREVAARDQELVNATQGIADVLGGRAVRTFLEQRLAAGDYQKQLGLIATIRRDLGQLSDLIRGHNLDHLDLPEHATALRTTLQRTRPDLQPAQIEELLKTIGLNRIVLYIDDLDRCPSKHVVEVLQAIHLLVSFPIFVVVVGVDSRWMAHALAHEYPALLTRTDTTAAEVADAVAAAEGRAPVTPADYLEKIFQIPFWIPALETDATQKLLVNLTSSPGTAPYGIAGSRQPAPPTLAGRGRDAQPDVATIAPLRTAGDRREETPSTPAAGDTKSAPLRPDLLRIGDEERREIQTLATVIGRSPRATKRFVNTYRLLKVALVGAEPGKFHRDSDTLGELRAPMFLLAIVTGVPTLTSMFVRALGSNLDNDVVRCLTGITGSARPEARHADAVRRVDKFAKEPGASSWRTLTGRELLPWLTRVSQFSFEDLPPVAVAPSGQPAS